MNFFGLINKNKKWTVSIYKEIFTKTKLYRNNFLRKFGLVLLVLILLIINSCVSLSDAARQQNIRIATSPYMIQGMQNIYAFTTNSTESIDYVAIVAANDAAKNGLSNITILVKYLGSAGGYFVYNTFITNNIYEISYWK